MADVYQDASPKTHCLIGERPKFDAALFLVFALFLSVLGSIISK
jgi:hypothetical protein